MGVIMKNLRLPLFLTRLSIFYFLLPWQLKRFTDPDGIDRIASTHYHLPGWSGVLATVTGVLWILLLIAFVTGFKKTISYGLVFVFHTGAILLSLQAYVCLLYTSPSPRDQRGSRMPSSA